MIGVSIGLHLEDVPMLCRICGKEMEYQSMVLQIGEVTEGNITPIEGLCDRCRDNTGTKDSKNTE
jgi:hypothetical protein